MSEDKKDDDGKCPCCGEDEYYSGECYYCGYGKECFNCGKIIKDWPHNCDNMSS